MWNKKCSEIFSEIIRRYRDEKIEYFILRNDEGLPENNISKDVDLVVNPKQFHNAKQIVLNVYKKYCCDYYYETSFDTLHCTHGINTKENYGIHIDILMGYRAKGYELFSFEEMYEHTYWKESLCVLEEAYKGFLTFITKIFGYRKPHLKDKYQKEIYDGCNKDEKLFKECLKELLGEKKAKDIFEKIQRKQFDDILTDAVKINRIIKRRRKIKAPLKSFKGVVSYWFGKIKRILILYRKYKKVIAVIATDGAGKTTLIEEIQKNINYFFVNDQIDRRCHIIHFRPTVLPNLGELGEKTGIMKQDTNWNQPHRNKPAGQISSFFRMAYYTLDYLIGWQTVVRNDVRFDRFTIFDRYGFDFLVDPQRSRIKLPLIIRKLFVSLMPKPNMVFVMLADAETIYQRKQELNQEEIERQNGEYKKLLKKSGFYLIDASKNLGDSGMEATKLIFEQFLKKVDL